MLVQNLGAYNEEKDLIIPCKHSSDFWEGKMLERDSNPNRVEPPLDKLFAKETMKIFISEVDGIYFYMHTKKMAEKQKGNEGKI